MKISQNKWNYVVTEGGLADEWDGRLATFCIGERGDNIDFDVEAIVERMSDGTLRFEDVSWEGTHIRNRVEAEEFIENEIRKFSDEVYNDE